MTEDPLPPPHADPKVEEAARSDERLRADESVDDLQELLARERAAHQADLRRARRALVAARAAKHAATRRADRAAKSVRELEELRQEVAQTAKEHRSSMDVLARDHQRSVERLNRRVAQESAALASERAVREGLERALADRTALAQSVDATGPSTLAAHDALVMGLRKELGAALGALAAERQRRGMEAIRAKALEKKRSSGSLRAVTLAEERPTHPPPHVLKPTGSRVAAHADARGMLHRILTRSLGGEARADKVLSAVLGSGGKALTMPGDELLAVLERSLHAELRGQIGEAGAHAVMDEIASALLAAASVRGEDMAHRLTTRPPPPLDVAPITKDMAHPALARPPGPAGRRSVLVIDRDRLSRANLSRVLAREGCEITVRDSCAGLDAAAAAFDVIVTEVVDVGIDDLIAAFTPHGAPCPVVAWTPAVDAARVMFHAAGIGRITVLAKEMRPDALVAAIRESLGEATGDARA